MRLGRHIDDLGTPALSWRDLFVIVAAAQPDTAIFKAMNPHWQRSIDVELLRAIELHGREWMWFNAEPRSRGKRPEVWEMPWDPEPEPNPLAGDVMSIDEMNDFLGWSAEMRDHWSGRGGA